MKSIAARSTHGKANYGIDALDIMRAFALTGAGLTLSSRLVPSLRLRGRALRFIGWALAYAGLANFSLAASMLAYGLRGNRMFCNRMLRMIDWRGDEHVLDVGTGRGLIMIAAAKRLTTGTSIGIDIRAPGSMSAARHASALHNADVEGVRSKIDVRTEDARRLTFADNAFDVILSTLCVHTIRGTDERAAACREIARVLKPGGTVLIADYTATAQFARMLGCAGLIVERSRPYMLESLTYLRVIAATKPI